MLLLSTKMDPRNPEMTMTVIRASAMIDAIAIEFGTTAETGTAIETGSAEDVAETGTRRSQP
jgi:hypothetical protein